MRAHRFPSDAPDARCLGCGCARRSDVARFDCEPVEGYVADFDEAVRRASERHLPPPCADCNGYGTHDGKPASEDPLEALRDEARHGCCRTCRGTGDAPSSTPDAHGDRR